MKIVYFSMTNNIKRFIDKIGIEAHDGNKLENINEPYILVTYTTGFGEVPIEVVKFLNKKINRDNLKYLVGSGNKNWGEMYCNALNILHEKLNAEILMTFELAGNKFDVELFLKKYNEIKKLNY